MDLNLEQIIIKKYIHGKTQKQIANELKISQTGVSLILRKNEVKTRVGKKIKYNINVDFFKKIQSEKQAYFLGLLYADGNVYKKNNTICIKLQKKDEYILHEFKNNISPQSKIKTIEVNKTKYAVFRLFQKEVCNQLISLGCIPNKSLTLKFPNLDQNLVNHFVRGYFDGDGTIYKNGKNYIWKIVSTKKFCERLKSILEKQLAVNCCLYVLQNKITSILLVGGNNQSMKVLDWMYDDSNICLKRKFDKYKEFKQLNQGK